MEKLRICMCGLGRTGKEIAAAVASAPDMELVMAICSNHNPHLGQDVSSLIGTPELGVRLECGASLNASVERNGPDVAIDFSTPEAVMKNAVIFAKHKVNMVIGTTGFSEIEIQRLQQISEKYKVGIVFAPNITLGVNVLMTLVNLAATLLEEYDCTITETHFKSKKDSPSGTAKKIANQVHAGIEARPNNSAVDSVPIHSLRTGGVIGQHSVILAGEHDKVEITHDSFSRKAFAVGAMRAARFVRDKVGYYEMSDVLELEEVISNYLTRNKMESKAHKPSVIMPYISQTNLLDMESIS